MHAALALVGDPEAGEYELLFSFSTPGDKDQFLDLVRSNEDIGSDYIENDFMSPTTEEIRNARPVVAVLWVVGRYFVRREETASAVTARISPVTN